MRRIANLLSAHALAPMGHFLLTPEDEFEGGQTLLLVGPNEPRFWPHFIHSAEFLDGGPDALDRWSRRVLDSIASELGARSVYPFGGPPFQPFISWAMRSGQAWPSPINILVHAERGLFVSYRGALILRERIQIEADRPRPCETCRGQPCTTACPVNAFADGYDVAACKAHVESDDGIDCRTRGCLARRACPVGQGTRAPQQAQFHMEAFL